MGFQGAAEMRRKLLGVKRAIKRNAVHSINLSAERIAAISQERVPVRRGFLKNSKQVILASIDQPEIEVIISYGGGLVDYAFVVHETHPTQSKFLEWPLLESVVEVAEGLVAAVQLDESLF